MSRIREEGGFTLMEVLVAATVGFVVLAATLGLLESTVRLNTGVMAKTDAMQRGRLAMDTLTQQLRSQVCLDWEHSAVIAGATDSSITFYTDYTDVMKTEKRQIVFDPVKREIRSLRFGSTSTATPPPPESFTIAKGSTVVLENVIKQYDDVKKQDVPFLTYYAYKTDATTGVLRAADELTPPLSPAAAARVARIDIAFQSLPTGAKESSRAVNLSDQVMARHADPNKSVPDPNCI